MQPNVATEPWQLPNAGKTRRLDWLLDCGALPPATPADPFAVSRRPAPFSNLLMIWRVGLLQLRVNTRSLQAFQAGVPQNARIQNGG